MTPPPLPSGLNQIRFGVIWFSLSDSQVSVSLRFETTPATSGNGSEIHRFQFERWKASRIGSWFSAGCSNCFTTADPT